MDKKIPNKESQKTDKKPKDKSVKGDVCSKTCECNKSCKAKVDLTNKTHIDSQCNNKTIDALSGRKKVIDMLNDEKSDIDSKLKSIEEALPEIEEKPIIFKCPNDIKMTISKDNGEVVFDEKCCTSISVVLKNTGEIGTSFIGAHNPQLVKVLEKTFSKYFKTLKKTLKKEMKNQEEEISLVAEDLPEDKKFKE